MCPKLHNMLWPQKSKTLCKIIKITITSQIKTVPQNMSKHVVQMYLDKSVFGDQLKQLSKHL